jgi:putative ABC transport system permease protein
LHVPKEQWEVSTVLVKVRRPFSVRSLQYDFNNGPVAMAVNPAEEMTQFFRVVLAPSSRVLLLISLLVTIVAAVAILVSIYNSVSARMREIAILRALGATRRRILALICLEAGLIGVFGGVLGLIAGHLIGAVGSIYTRRVVGESINWTYVGGAEWLYLLVVTLIAVLAGLVPAMKAYRSPVATNLTAG